MIRLLAVICTLPVAAWAEVPRVMTDIAPIHSLTAQVMGDLGRPDLLLPPGADPHDFALRPSDAERLSDANLVIWVGDDLMPWLTGPLATLAPDAAKLALADSQTWLPIRTDDTEDGPIDPHGWLDPNVARVWVVEIATALGAADPANADTYLQNADTAIADLIALHLDIKDRMYAFEGAQFIVPHDGYRYFEQSYGLSHANTVAGVHGHDPGPAHLAELRDEVIEDQIACVFHDAEIGEDWVNVITEGTSARTAFLDGTGAGLTPGPDLYGQVLNGMAAAFEECLAGS